MKENYSEQFIALFAQTYEQFHREWQPQETVPSSEALAILLHLRKTGPLSLSEASKHFQRSTSATTEIIQRMQKHAWVEKLPDPADQRTKYIWITPQGEKVLRECSQPLDSQKISQVFDNWESSELDQLVNLFKKLVNHP